jgi:hypothetical protein
MRALHIVTVTVVEVVEDRASVDPQLQVRPDSHVTDHILSQLQLLNLTRICYNNDLKGL